MIRPLLRRWFASAPSKIVADRIPVLEELFEVPVLRTKDMRAESISEVKGFVPPVLTSQIEASLLEEFKQPILETDWNQYENPLDSWEQAARLIHYTLAIYSNVGGENRDLAATCAQNQAWIRQECSKLYEEIKTGDYTRWESLDSMIGVETKSKLTSAQLDAVRPAVALLGRNPHLHPKVKQEVIREICSVIMATITE